MESLVRFSLKQKVFYNLLFVMLTVAGAFAFIELPAERYPNVHFGEVTVSTFFPGASPEDVETLVTRKIEETLESIEELEWISATSYRQRSYIRLKFIDDSDYTDLFDEVRFRVLNVAGELPDSIDPPSVQEAKVDDYLPVVAINLAGDRDNRSLALMGDELKTALRQIPGVKEVRINGEYPREFHIYLDPNRLRALGVSYESVAEALRNANVSIPAGNFNTASGEFTVKVDETFRSREQVVSTVVRRDGDGSFIRVADLISRAEAGYRDPLVISSINGKNALALQIIKSTGGSALDIREGVDRVLENFAAQFEREGVELIMTQDSTVYINDALSTLSMNMLVGMLLVSGIIWYFMGLRNAGLVTIGIPFSFMLTMLLMYLTGNSLNEITLFAFVLVTGIIVDDAIVVTENIYRHVEKGDPLYTAITRGTAEVALPVISATMTTVAAFLPMLIMTGSTGEFFAQIPMVVSFAIIASLIECLLILPIHYLDFGPRKHEGKPVAELDKDNVLLALLRRISEAVLAATMRHRLRSVSLVVIAFVASVVILVLSVSGKVPLIQIQFFPDDYRLYYVDVEGPTSTPLEVIDLKVREISEDILDDGPGMARSAAGFAGFIVNDDYEPIYGNNRGTVMVSMPSRDQQAFDDPLIHLQQMSENLKSKYEKDGIRLRVHAQKDGPPQGKDINVRVLGDDLVVIGALADEILQFINTQADFRDDLVDVEDDRGAPKRVFRFRVQHEKASEFGLDSQRVARLAASVLDGRYIGKYRLTDEEVDLKLYVDPVWLREPSAALGIPIIEQLQGPVLLSDVTRLDAYNEAGELHRYQGRRAISIKGNIRTGSSTSVPAVVAGVSDYVNSVQSRYPGTTVIFSGEHEDTQRSYRSLAYAFVIAVLAMYLI
ncbi:RND multidrug efflux transporter; Acriflavin resistance protein, partial [hydrothermal vent metagenome]